MTLLLIGATYELIVDISFWAYGRVFHYLEFKMKRFYEFQI